MKILKLTRDILGSILVLTGAILFQLGTTIMTKDMRNGLVMAAVRELDKALKD